LHPLWRFLSGLTTPSPDITDRGIREQSALLSRLLLFMLVWTLAMALLIRLVLIPAAGWSNPQLVLAALFLCVLLLAHHANRRGHYLIAAVLTVGGLLAGIFAGAHLSLLGLMEPSYARDDVNILAYLLVPVILGALLLPMKWLTATLVVAMAGVLFVPSVHPQVELSALLYGPLLYVVAVGVLLLFFAHVVGGARRRSHRMVEWREERYRSLFEQSPDAVFLVAPDGTVEAVNHAGLALFGYEQGELEGRHVREIYAVPEEREMVVANVERKGSLKDEPLRLRKKDGSVIDCLVSVRPRHDSAGLTTGYQTVVRDVTERVRIEEELRLKGQLLDLAHDVVLLVDPGGEIVYANAACAALTGYSLAELADMNMRQLNTREGAEQVPTRISTMLREGGAEFDSVWVRKDGQRVDVEVRSQTVESRGRPLFLSVVRDITRRKADQADLRLRSELLDLSMDAVFLHDLNGKLLYVNESAATQTGYTRAELTGMTLRELDDPETSARMRNRMAELMNKREIAFEGGHRRKDGTVIPVDVRARLVDWEDRGIVLYVARDISERKRAEAALRESEDKFRSLFEQSMDAISVSRPDGTGVEANRAWLTLFGYERDELECLNFRNLYVDLLEHETFIQAIDVTGLVEDEVQLKRKDGSIFVCHRTTVARRDGEGNVVLFQGVFHDVTEQRRAEQALSESEEKYRALFERSMDAVCLVAADGTLLEANKAYLELYGYDAADVGRANVREHYVNPADRDEYLRVLERDGVVIGHHTKAMRTDGTVMDCVRSSVAHRDEAGRIVTIQTVTRDVTEDRRREMALADELTRRRILVEQSRDGIVVLDEDGKAVETNLKFAEMLGYSPQEVLQLHVSDWDVPTPPDRLNEMIRTVDESGDHFETQHRRRDGTVYDVEISTNAAVFAGRKLIFCVCRDISARKRAERELRESEEKYRALFEQSMDAICVNTPDGVTIDANQTWLDLFGYTREELRNVTTADTYADPAERADFLRRIEQSGFVADEVRLKKKDGTVFDCQRAVFARKDDSGNVVAFQGVFRDITARKHAEQELRESEQRYRLIADDTADIIWRMDLNMVFTYVNPAIQRVFGFGPEEWVGSSLADHCSPSEFARIRAIAAHEIQNYSRTQEAGSGILFEATMLDKTGVELPVEVRAKLIVDAKRRPIALHGITRDIRERRRTEQQLRDSEARFRALVEHTGLAMTITNAEGSILDCNDVFLQRLGYTRDEALSMRVTDMYASLADRERMISRTLSDGYVRDVEVEFKRKDGSRVWVSLTSALVSQKGGLVIVSQALDITARKATEQELLRSREELKRSAEQLHELTSYLEEAREKERTGIARELHDQLGQALTALTMDLDGVRRAATAGEPVPADRLDRMATLLNDTVNDVRRISSDLRPGILDDAGLVAAIEWQLDRFRERSSIDCGLEASTDDSVLDRPRATALFRVFQELLTNVARHAGATQVRVAFECDSNVCSLSVSDDGRGITDEQASSTTSLGIIGVRERLRPLGGDIEFINRSTKGTTAKVTVPIQNANRHAS
jgi:PAS domain S-box-containing protein